MSKIKDKKNSKNHFTTKINPHFNNHSLKDLLHQSSRSSLKELSDSLSFEELTVSSCLKSRGLIHKLGNRLEGKSHLKAVNNG